jgi:predicted acylesterase/phospholipase RssA
MAAMLDPRYANPSRLCDLVMKGGVTSGVIYPRAVCELATRYSFKNIGGTSAGAIAAAATAAAEYGRRQNLASAGSFASLTELPAWIGQPGRLLAMFRPDPSTRSLFRLAMAGMNPRTVPGKAIAITKQLLINYTFTALALILAAIAVSRMLAASITGGLYIYAVAATIVVASLLFLLRVVFSLYRQLTRTLPANFYGLSSACDPAKGHVDAPLTNWLSGYLNTLAGKDTAGDPLTFGDLYRAQRAPGDPEAPGDTYKSINLEMMTTAVNMGRPFRLPFQDPNQVFYFSKEEFARLFPESILKYMIEHAREEKPGNRVPEGKGVERLYGFPKPEHLPVVVATRMSLSFPMLLSAVPLYVVDFTRSVNQERKEKGLAPYAERCWFSDGGICSNLPIHFFDAPLPQWPTFAINLKQFHPDHQTENDAVWLPGNAGSGWLPSFVRFEPSGEFGLVSSFLAAIIGTMQNWQDNTQSRAPGYRDRLVHVSQRDEEGGLNLDMPAQVITRLAERGRRAGLMLIERFDDPPNVRGGWAEHRWVRLRSCMDLTLDWVQRIAESYPRAVPPDPQLHILLDRGDNDPPSAYRLGSGDRKRASAVIDALVKFWTEANANGTGFDDKPPRPAPELRVKAGI